MVENQLRNTDPEGGGVPLTSLLPGERARIVALGHGKGQQHHFRTMGLMEGKIVKLIATQPARGPFVIDIEGTQIAVGRGMARHILIEKL
ncbi:MAG TPA: FeoA family protein [Desulfobacteria bacterium]|nr:FeoA family protein [Desulfobacteria bacterium]